MHSIAVTIPFTARHEVQKDRIHFDKDLIMCDLRSILFSKGRFLASSAIILWLLWVPFSAQSQQRAVEAGYRIEWRGVEKINISENEKFERLTFSGAVYTEDLSVPYWHMIYGHRDKTGVADAELIPVTVSRLSPDEVRVIRNAEIGGSFLLKSEPAIIQKEFHSEFFILPIRKISEGVYERLESFELKMRDVIPQPQLTPVRRLKGNSLLATGDWYKVKVSRNGIHRLDYNQLVTMGLSGGGSGNIRVYGMGGGVLPEQAGAPRPDGLQEIAIQVVDGGDGSIDQGDYLLFYAEGAGKWEYDAIQNIFVYRKHHYDDYNYYFLTRGSSPGLRIQAQTPPGGQATHLVHTFHDFSIYENDSLNLIKSGKTWLGEEFDIRTTYQFNFSFPNIDPQSDVQIITSVAARSLTSSSFTIQSGTNTTSAGVYAISAGYNNQYAFQASKAMSFKTSGSNLPVTITYSKPLSSSTGWLDYILVNLRRELKMAGTQMAFRDPKATGTGNIAAYTIEQTTASTGIWDITDPFAPERIQPVTSGSTTTFHAEASALREFVAFSGASFHSPELIGKVANQNLAGSNPVEMVIVSHPDFLQAANRLAALHQQKGGITSLIVTPGMIYNEFSSGKQDPGAIRDFMKMLYDRAATPKEMPRYLLLFGDGSYDNKNRVNNNTNFIPTFQSEESLHPAYTFVTDDYYGLLDDHEGINGSGHLDIGIGRIPVATAAEAMQMVDKIERYMSDNTVAGNSSICTGAGNTRPLADWRNTVCLIADDEDSNLHIDQAEMLTDYLDAQYGVYNLNKLYLDAYQQESISGGHRYPDVNDAINKQMERGALIMNYIGHGGELGWAHERILRIDDIMQWSNTYNMPLFLTSTCEFSRFDDPARRSAGELVFLNPQGGGIALFTTTRLAFASSNYAFNTAFYQNIFKKTNGEYNRLGDAFMWSKINAGSVSSNRNMVILGDPALKLAYPKHQVVTTHINDAPITAATDTLKALAKITVKGAVVDQSEQVLHNFNGTLYPVVYDKKVTFTTLANDAYSYPKPFWMQKNTLYKGKVSVREGLFSFSFIVPKDIAYAYGYGKISYYAENGTEDAHGYFDKVIVGGTSTAKITDLQGPEVKLYMNDSLFVFGGTTDANPVLFAKVRDEYGINTTGGGIGHDIVAVLDGNSNKSMILNDYYEADLDSYNSGTITYGLSNLEEGAHHLSLKVWDIFNNSSETYTEFIVASADKPILTHVLNYPNPFTTHTEFWFEHNQPCCDIEAMVEVFTVSGKLVKTIRQTISTVGYRAEPIPWDGLDDFGDRLARGVYVYKVTIRNKELKTAEKFEKLVILR
jgi:hypothetical protein